MEQNKRKAGRPRVREGIYIRKDIEIRADLLDFLDTLPESLRANIEEALIDLKAKKEKKFK